MKRSIARGGLLAALLAIVVVSTALLQGLALLSADEATAETTSTLHSSPARSVALRVSTAYGGDDPSNPFDFGSLDVQVWRSVVADPVDGIIVEANESLRDHARLVSGEWGSAMLQARAARLLGVAAGDTITLEGGLAVRVTGTWLPEDASEAYWFADPAAASGTSGDAFGPLVVAEADLAQLPAQVSVQWVIVPGQVAPGELQQLAVALDSVEAHAATVTNDYLTIDGTLETTLVELRSRLDAQSRLAAVPIVLTGLIGALTLLRVATLLWSVRRGESALLRSRGATRLRLLAAAAVEALVLVVAGTAPFAALSPLVAGTVAIGGAAVLLVAAWRGIDAANPRTERISRARVAITAAGALLAAIAAGVSLWQFLLYSTAEGANPLGSLAPALGLLCLALVALLALPLAFTAIERFAARGHGLGRVYASRHAARDIAVHATSIVLIVMVVGAATLAASYAGSTRDVIERANASSPDVRARLDRSATVDDTYVPATLWTGFASVDSTTPALVTTARVASDELEFVASSPPAAGTTSGVVELAVSSTSTGSLELAVWASDELGQPIRIPAGNVDLPFDGTATAQLPPGEWTVLALEAHVGGISGTTAASVRLDEQPLALTVAHPTGRAMLAEGEDELAVSLSADAARLLSAAPGDAISLTVPSIGASIDAVVGEVVTPGSALAVSTDLHDLTDYLLRTGQRVAQPNELWLQTAEPSRVSAELRAVSPVSVSLTTRESAAGRLSSIFWLGVAGSGALTVIAVWAVAASLGRLREGNSLVLSALGVSRGRRALIQFLEFTIVLVAALLSGVAAGVIASWLYSPTLAGATGGFDLAPWLVAVGGVTAASLAIGAISARRAS